LPSAGTIKERIRQINAEDIFHGETMHAIGLTKPSNRYNIRVSKLSRNFGFRHEHSKNIFVCHHVGMKYL
jgi:hypothetical protein